MISKNMNVLVQNSSMIRAMFEEGKKLAEKYGKENVYDYSLGNPSVATPEKVKDAIKKILDEERPSLVHGYMNNSGYEDVREKLALYNNTTFETKLKKEHIVMTCGAAGGLNIIFKALLDPEDEVLTFAPYFGEYRNYANNFNANLVVVPADRESFQPDLSNLDDYISEKTKIVLVNSPNNPSGVIYTEESIEKLCDILRAKEKQYGHSIYLVSDEPYREIVYNGAKVPYLLNYYKNSMVAYSFSKALSLPGERIGYISINSEIEEVSLVLSALNVANRILGFVNAPSLFQRVVAEIIGMTVDMDIYKRNRDLLYTSLLEFGYEAVEPEGAFYLLLKSPIEDDIEFCKIAKKYNLLLVPGTGFGISGYVRIAYCVSHDTVKNSIPAFAKLIKEFKK